MNARFGLAVVLTLFAGVYWSPEPLTPSSITIPVMPRTAPIMSPQRVRQLLRLRVPYYDYDPISDWDSFSDPVTGTETAIETSAAVGEKAAVRAVFMKAATGRS